MKKGISLFITAAVCAALVGCGGSSSSSSNSAAPTQAPAAVEATAEPAAESTETADVDLDAIVSAIEAVNEVSNPRVIDDFSLVNEMGVTADNIVAFKGDVTNDQANCALVFAAQVKDGAADAVVAELEAYRESMSSSLYAEFADKVAKAQDARIVAKGNTVVMVIAGVDGPDYSEIDTAINGAIA